MRRLDHVEPLRGRELVGADDRAHLVVEDFGRGARQRAEARALQLGQELRDRDAERRRALRDLERRERMDMDVGHRVLDRAADREIGRAGVIGMDAALQADFGRAALPGLAAAALDLVELEIVRPAAQVVAELAFGEGAELAAEVADVGVVDVAVDDVGDAVAARFGAQRVGGGADGVEIRSPRAANSATISLSPSARPRGGAIEQIGARPSCADRAARASPAASASRPGIHASARAKPSASAARSTGVRSAGSSQRSARAT